MNPYLSEKARGEIPRVLKWLRNAGLAFCVFCSVGGLYTLCLSLQDKDYSHIGGYVFWIVVGAVPLALFARGEARRYHARTIARRVENYSGPEVPLRWLYNSVGMDAAVCICFRDEAAGCSQCPAVRCCSDGRICTGSTVGR